MFFSIFPISSTTFIISGIFLSVFSHNRFKEYIKVSNIITYQYWIASFFVSIAFFVYGISGLITDKMEILSIFAGIALTLNAIGFSYFFLIPLSGWLKPSVYVLVKYGLFLFTAILVACLIIIPPAPIIMAGIIHWRFGLFVGILASIHMNLAFMLNIIQLGMHFYRLKRFSVVNTIALIITFILAGFGGTYQYLGDSHMSLVVSSISLCIGVGSVFFSVVRGSISRNMS